MDAPALRTRQDPGAVCGPGLRRGRGGEPGRRQSGLLVDQWSLLPAARKGPGRIRRCRGVSPRQLRVVSQPPGVLHPDLSSAGRPAYPTGRRTDHRRRRFSDDGGAGDSARSGAGLRRRRPGDRQHRHVDAHRGAELAHQGGHGRTHARKPLRYRCCVGLLRSQWSLAGRGQL